MGSCNHNILSALVDGQFIKVATLPGNGKFIGRKVLIELGIKIFGAVCGAWFALFMNNGLMSLE